MLGVILPPVPRQSAQPPVGINEVAGVEVPILALRASIAAASIKGLAEQFASTGLRGRLPGAVYDPRILASTRPAGLSPRRAIALLAR